MVDLRHIEGRLERVLGRARDLLPQAELDDLEELVVAGEPGVALENLCAQLHEHDVSVAPDMAAELAAIAAAMGIRLQPALKIRA